MFSSQTKSIVKLKNALKKGGSVLLLTFGKVGKTKGAQVAIGFSSIFWNTAWTNNQPPHTLGILCDPGHPVFSGFPLKITVTGNGGIRLHIPRQ